MLYEEKLELVKKFFDKNPDIYNKLIVETNAIAYYLGGSQLIGITDERSDYDIIVVVEEFPSNHIALAAIHYELEKGVMAHFIFERICQYFDGAGSALEICSMSHILDIYNKRDQWVVIHDSEKFRKICEFIFGKRNKLIDLAIRRIYKRFDLEIIYITNTNQIPNKMKTKYYYHLIYAYKRAFDKEIDAKYLALLKRIRWVDLPEWVISTCIEDLREVRTYVEQNPVDNAKEINDLIIEYNSLFNGNIPLITSEEWI